MQCSVMHDGFTLSGALGRGHGVDAVDEAVVSLRDAPQPMAVTVAAEAGFIATGHGSG